MVVIVDGVEFIDEDEDSRKVVEVLRIAGEVCNTVDFKVEIDEDIPVDFTVDVDGDGIFIGISYINWTEVVVCSRTVLELDSEVGVTAT